jgi:hypothetical protein
VLVNNQDLFSASIHTGKQYILVNLSKVVHQPVILLLTFGQKLSMRGLADMFIEKESTAYNGQI